MKKKKMDKDKEEDDMTIVLMAFKIILTVIPYDLRVYSLYFMCKELYMSMPFDWKVIWHECDKSKEERSI